MKRIKSLPVSLRPREKLLKRGAESLSTEELLSVILVTGTKRHAVSQLASAITKLLKKTDIVSSEQLQVLHAGPTKSAQILAAIELGKRMLHTTLVSFTTPGQIYASCYDIAHEEKELLICFYLNARGELLKKETVVVGSMNRASVLPREIFSMIKELPVAAIILAHNHPSGALEPSREDILFTKRVKQSGDILGVKLLGHLIVTAKGFRQIKV